VISPSKLGENQGTLFDRCSTRGSPSSARGSAPSAAPSNGANIEAKLVRAVKTCAATSNIAHTENVTAAKVSRAAAPFCFLLPVPTTEPGRNVHAPLTRRKRPAQPCRACDLIRAELIGTNSATAQKMVVTSAAPILSFCRQLVAAGHDPATPLEAYRGDTLCVRIRSIGQAAQLEPSPSGVGFVYRHSRLRAAPSIATTEAACTEGPGRAGCASEAARHPTPGATE
jgi:hypothetical protein